MVSKGNKDMHNYNYGHVRGVKVQEQEKWGRATAVRRYGELKQTDMKPRDMSQPEDPGSRADHSGLSKAFNDCRPDWRNGFGKGGIESAEGYPHFDLLRQGQEPPRPKAGRPTNPGTGDIRDWRRDGRLPYFDSVRNGQEPMPRGRKR